MRPTFHQGNQTSHTSLHCKFSISIKIKILTFSMLEYQQMMMVMEMMMVMMVNETPIIMMELKYLKEGLQVQVSGAVHSPLMQPREHQGAQIWV